MYVILCTGISFVRNVLVVDGFILLDLYIICVVLHWLSVHLIFCIFI